MNREIKYRVRRLDAKFIVAIEWLSDKGWVHQMQNNITAYGDKAPVYEGPFSDKDFGWKAALQREQYTGLKDKNGVEVYEGDVLMVYNDKETMSSGFENSKGGEFLIKHQCDMKIVIGQSEYPSPMYTMYFIKNGQPLKWMDVNGDTDGENTFDVIADDISYLKYISDKSVVIGNIYSNPDLLTQTKSINH